MWWCEAAGMWHSDPWQLDVLDGPGLGNRKELGGGRLAPWPWGGMEGKKTQGAINPPPPSKVVQKASTQRVDRQEQVCFSSD